MDELSRQLSNYSIVERVNCHLHTVSQQAQSAAQEDIRRFLDESAELPS
jgi:hypothetical protein